MSHMLSTYYPGGKVTLSPFSSSLDRGEEGFGYLYEVYILRRGQRFTSETRHGTVGCTSGQGKLSR